MDKSVESYIFTLKLTGGSAIQVIFEKKKWFLDFRCASSKIFSDNSLTISCRHSWNRIMPYSTKYSSPSMHVICRICRSSLKLNHTRGRKKYLDNHTNPVFPIYVDGHHSFLHGSANPTSLVSDFFSYIVCYFGVLFVICSFFKDIF